MSLVVDSCVLLDIALRDPEFGIPSALLLESRRKQGLVACPISIVEICPQFDGKIATIKDFLRLVGAEADSPWLAQDTRKGSGTAHFYSREAGSHKPELRLTLESGQQTLTPAADTYVQVGAKDGKGGEAELLVRGSKPGVALDGDTCRALLQFDMGAIAPAAIQKAECDFVTVAQKL